MANIRLNSEKKFENPIFKIKVGTTNKLNPQVIYVEGKAFVSPQYDSEDFVKDINDIRHSFKHTISKELHKNNVFDTQFIIDFQIASTRIIKDKKSFLSFQFILKQKNKDPFSLKEIITKSNGMFNDIIYSLSEEFHCRDFVITKNKK